jgi:hypothetical protein
MTGAAGVFLGIHRSGSAGLPYPSFGPQGGEARRQATEAGPRPKDQINLTDEDSRIMPVAGNGFDQCYNAQLIEPNG